MIKVLEVSSDSNIGGAGKCIVTFLKHYDRGRFDVGAVVPTGSKLLPEIEALGVKTYELDRLAEKSLDAGAVKLLKKLFKRLRPDIVHTHGCMSARIAAKLCGIKVVYTRHSVFEPSPRLSRGIGKLINGAVNSRAADRIIAVAEAAKDNLTATGVPEKKIDVILNGVEPLREYSPDEREKARAIFGIAPDEKAAAIIARLTEAQGAGRQGEVSDRGHGRRGERHQAPNRGRGSQRLRENARVPDRCGAADERDGHSGQLLVRHRGHKPLAASGHEP